MRIREVRTILKVSDPLVTFSTSLISFFSIATCWSKLALNVGDSLLGPGRFPVYVQHTPNEAAVENSFNSIKDVSKVRDTPDQIPSSLHTQNVNGITRNSVFETFPKTSQEAIDMTVGSFNESENEMVPNEVTKDG